MNTTAIEWTDRTWNPVTGCRHGCAYCYAKGIAERFPKAFPAGFDPMFRPDRLGEPAADRRPRRIFVSSMGDLFGDWVPDEWINAVLDAAREGPRHTFQFLTKNPARYAEFDLPPNGWYGATVDQAETLGRLEDLRGLGGITFVSFEPLLGPIDPDLTGIDWVIVGALSRAGRVPAMLPESRWVQDIIYPAREAGARIFLKNSLDELGFGPMQEYPRAGGATA